MPVAPFLTRTSEPQVIKMPDWREQCQYTRIESMGQLNDWLFPVAEGKLAFGADTETNTLDIWRPESKIEVIGLSLSRGLGDACYIPVAHRIGYEHNLPLHKVIELLQLLDRLGCRSLWYNASYDLEVLSRTVGWEPEHFEEVMWGVWLKDCDQKQFGLKDATERELGLLMMTFEEVTGGTRNFLNVHPEDAVPYACADADCTRRLWLHPPVVDAVRRQSQVYTLERALITPMRRMMRNGIWFDDAVLETIELALGGEIKQAGGKLVREAAEGGRIKALIDRIYAANGGPVNLDSPDQVGAMLLKLGVAIEEKTDTKKVATGDEVLAKYRQYPVVRDVIEYRKLAAFDRNYVRKLRAGIQQLGPCLRFPFKQIGAPTGRMSCSGEGRKAEYSFERGVVALNLQSIPDPKKDKSLPDLRAAVVANPPQVDPESPEAFDIVAIDYSQLQLRIAANLSREPEWVKAFLEDIDIHLRNGQIGYGEMFPRYLPDGSEDPRRGKGKTMGFAVLFGAEDKTVAEHGGIGVAEAKNLLDNFWRGVPTLAAWVQSSHARARLERKVKSWLGRERPLNYFYQYLGTESRRKFRWMEEKGDREAVNGMIQAGEAELYKIAICRVDNLLTARDWHADCQVTHFMHDEIVFRIRRARKMEIVPAIMGVMDTIKVTGWPVPCTTEAESGHNWGLGLRSYGTPKTVQPLAAAAPVTPSRTPQVVESLPDLPDLPLFARGLPRL